MAGIWAAEPRAVWHCQPLFWLLAYGPALLAVGCIAMPTARAFTANGQRSVLMLGCGMWVNSLGVVGGALGAARGLDVNWAIYNSANLLAALCHVIGVAVASRPRIGPRHAFAWLGATYGGGLAAVGLIAWGAFTGGMPAFYRAGQGGTLVHSLVAGTTVALFGVSAARLWHSHRRAPSPFLYWYALGLMLIAAGLAGSMLISAVDSPLQWVTRTTRAGGTVYLCVAVLAGRQMGGTRQLTLAGVAHAWRERSFLAGLDGRTLLAWALRYGSAVAAVAAAFLGRLALAAWFGPGLPPYLTFYPAVLTVALIAGIGPGLLAATLAGLTVAFRVQDAIASSVDRLGLVAFIGMGLFTSLVAELYRRARNKAAAYDREMARRESEAKYHTLFTNMTEEVHVWKLDRDADGRIETWRLVDANPPALRTWGQTLSGVLGRTTDEIFGPGATEHYLPVVRKIMEEGVPHSFEDYFPHLDRHFRFTSVPMGDHFITTGADITDLKQSQAALEDAARRKDDFIALLGHELRNPLAPIGYAVHTLRQGGQDPELVQSVCAIVERQVAHMTRLVDDLLNVSRMSLGKIQLQKETLDLEETVRSVVADYRPSLQESGLALAVHASGEPVRVEADRARIVQTVSNLLHNAVKFTDPGGRIEVAVDVARPGWGRVRVKDSGIGIDPEQLGSLFDPFMQAKETVGRSRGGLGLGLALVKGLVALHGGQVSVRSGGPGQGAEFSIELPLLQDSGPAAPPAQAAGGRHPVHPRRILVVEDLLDSALTLQLLLQMWGHTVAIAQDGQSGLDQARRFKPDVILCDIGLPGALSGHDVARTIRATPGLQGIHLVALSGFGTPEDKERARQAGFDSHLTKPVDPAILEPMLARLGPCASATVP
jgi:signal transduction histidine kinase